MDTGGADWRPFGEAADELVEKLFGADVEVERVTAILDTYIQ